MKKVQHHVFRLTYTCSYSNYNHRYYTITNYGKCNRNDFHLKLEMLQNHCQKTMCMLNKAIISGVVVLCMLNKAIISGVVKISIDLHYQLSTSNYSYIHHARATLLTAKLCYYRRLEIFRR